MGTNVRFRSASMISRRRMLGLGLVGLAGALGGASLLRPRAKAPNQPPAFAGEMQAFLPAAEPKSATELVALDGDGRALRLADMRGKVVLINFWATWCAPCVRELPALARLAERLTETDFKLLALSSDRGGKRVVEPFLAKIELSGFPVHLDENGVTGRAFGVRGLPTSVLIDRAGRDVGRLEGSADWDGEAGFALIRYYLSTPR